MSKPAGRVHMIGNAHIDPVWQWSWPEGFMEALATFKSALDRMDETPEFTFTAGQSLLYEWIEKVDPGMFSAIQQRVAEGRWSIVNGWPMQPDCNMPSGESFVRHSLYGKEYFADRFGVDVTVGYNVDSFGHSAGLPQLLNKAGLSYYIFFRPGVKERTLPWLFEWQGVDGSRVLACRPPGHYQIHADQIEQQIKNAAEFLSEQTPDVPLFYGVGNHGGGPTKEIIELLLRLMDDDRLPEIRFSTLPEFFARAEAFEGTPVVADELQMHAPGCYTISAELKNLNRRSEAEVGAAEILACVSELHDGSAYPGEEIEKAWNGVLYNQFHDILPGSLSETPFGEIVSKYGGIRDSASMIANTAIQRICRDIDTSECNVPLVIFNPHPNPLRVPVEFEMNVDYDWRENRPLSIYSDTGERIAIEELALEPAVDSMRRRRVRMIAELPPCGYRLYDARAEDAEPLPLRVKADATSMESDMYRLEFDPATGNPISLYDKMQGIEMLGAHGIHSVIMEDESDAWGHRMETWDKEIGSFGGAEISVESQGPVSTTMKILTRYGNSEIHNRYTLYAEWPLIRHEMRIFWNEKNRMLKMIIPFAGENNRVFREIAAGALEDTTSPGTESTMHRWIDMTGWLAGKHRGIAIVNDGKYGYDTRDSEVRISLLRNTPYTWHDPAELDTSRYYTDTGMHRMTFWLCPHEGTWQELNLSTLAGALNQSPYATVAYRHDGTLDAAASWLQVEPASVELMALKKAQDGNGYIIRVRETSGKQTACALNFPGVARHLFALEPFEVRTFRAARGKIAETDLLA